MQKIGILGSGQVAQALARGFVKHGYEVMMGTRTPEKINDWKSKENIEVQAGTDAETAAWGELIVIAVKGSAAEEVVKSAGAGLNGKTVIDVCNPIADLPPENGVLRYFTNFDESLMERLQKSAPEAHFVKAFNSVGNALMVNPDFGGTQPTMFICGDNADAKKEVSEIVEKFGWESLDMGGKESARAIEPLCMLWCIPGILRNKWADHAFKMLCK
jgi:predicted dinucleotide-binding enzyme